MGTHRTVEHDPSRTRLGAPLTWIGGGDGRAGIVVVVTSALAWLAAAGALAGSPRLPIGAAIAIGLLVGLLVGVVSRAVAGGAHRGTPTLVGGGLVALAVGAIAGELASVLLFSGSIERRIDDQAALAAQSAPAVVQASDSLERARNARAGLDVAVDQARTGRDDALVVARCEFNPSPDCPQTHITGVPGSGPETRTANQMLADAQQELDTAVAARDARAAALDAGVDNAEQSLAAARAGAAADPGRGLGARWVAMNGYTLADAGALVLRVVLLAFFGLLTMLPLLLRRWRGETAGDREAAARTERDNADLAADTAIAVKQAEVRTETENLWAEQQLAHARMAVAAQNAIDRERHRRRVVEFAVDEDMYLPIAAEAERAASAAPTGNPLPLSAEPLSAKPLSAEPVSAELEPAAPRPTGRTPLIPLPDVDPLAGIKAAARWLGPLVPDLVSRAIDTGKQPLRVARQAFEEVEEITFSLKRVHKVTLHSEERADGQRASNPGPVPAASGWVDSSVQRRTQIRAGSPELADGPAPAVIAAAGPRQLPPAESD